MEDRVVQRVLAHFTFSISMFIQEGDDVILLVPEHIFVFLLIECVLLLFGQIFENHVELELREDFYVVLGPVLQLLQDEVQLVFK